VSAQFPVFAVLEKQHEGIYVGTVDIKIESTAVAVTEPRLSLLSAFIAALPKMAGHSEGLYYNPLQCVCLSATAYRAPDTRKA
jgi:hypothetical protein